MERDLLKNIARRLREAKECPQCHTYHIGHVCPTDVVQHDAERSRVHVSRSADPWEIAETVWDVAFDADTDHATADAFHDLMDEVKVDIVNDVKKMLRGQAPTGFSTEGEEDMRKFITTFERVVTECADRTLREDAHDNKGNNFKLPTTHIPAVRVPKGGASCKNCKWLGPDGSSCAEPHFIEWNYGDGKLPFPADEYCSDWWEPKSGTPDSGKADAPPPPPPVGASPPSPSGRRVVHLKLPTK